jgi:hypothetical protein
MGRAGIPLSQFISEEGLEDELWLPLGKGEWTNLEGPVSRKTMHSHPAATRCGPQHWADESINAVMHPW